MAEIRWEEACEQLDREARNIVGHALQDAIDRGLPNSTVPLTAEMEAQKIRAICMMEAYAKSFVPCFFEFDRTRLEDARVDAEKSANALAGEIVAAIETKVQQKALSLPGLTAPLSRDLPQLMLREFDKIRCGLLEEEHFMSRASKPVMAAKGFWALVALAALFVVVSWVVVFIFAIGKLQGGFSATIQQFGTFGDTFGGVNALFTGLAFIGVAAALFLQRAEFNKSVKAQQDAAEEQAKVFVLQQRLLDAQRASAAAQQKLAEQQRRLVESQQAATIAQQASADYQALSAKAQREWADGQRKLIDAQDGVARLHQTTAAAQVIQAKVAALSTSLAAKNAVLCSFTLPETLRHPEPTVPYEGREVRVSQFRGTVLADMARINAEIDALLGSLNAMET
jgi:hypothetical protein